MKIIEGQVVFFFKAKKDLCSEDSEVQDSSEVKARRKVNPKRSLRDPQSGKTPAILNFSALFERKMMRKSHTRRVLTPLCTELKVG
ncbi:hypothetical protein FQN60_017851, partial [Etheostoma spectabile]